MKPGATGRQTTMIRWDTLPDGDEGTI